MPLFQMRLSLRLLGPFRLPTDRNWSKQHPRIRTPRPLVDRFNLGNMHPNKEWWRERRIAPATFMGFPDVTKAELVGGSLYTEQMDAATLAVIVDKCVLEGITNAEFWAKFSWRCQQIINSITETDAAYLFRGFSRANFFDSHLALSLWGRIDWLLPKVNLSDASVIIEGFNNPKYRNARYEHRVLAHMQLLVEARDDWTPMELCKAAAAVGQVDSGNQLRQRILRTVASKLPNADLTLVDTRVLAGVLEAFATLNVKDELEALLAIARDLEESGKLTKRNRGAAGDEAVRILTALAKLGFVELHPSLCQELAADYFDNIYKLSHDSLLKAASLVLRKTVLQLPENHREVLLRRIARECYKLPSELACRMLTALLDASPLNGDEMTNLTQECVSECLVRLAQTGVEGVDPSVLLETRRAIESCPSKTEDMNILLQVIALLS